MMVATVPLFQPVPLGYGIGAIRFGGAVDLLIALGQITRPPGRNFFAMHGVSSEKLGGIVRGTVVFQVLFDVLIFIILKLWAGMPELAFWLPSQLTA